jgi:hypothetical protein
MSKGYKSEESSEVERPDAQNAAHIERLDMDTPGLLALTQQKFDDRERTQKKEHWDAEGSRYTDGVGPWLVFGIDWHVVHAMKPEYDQKGEEAESVEFWTVKPLGGQIVGFDCAGHF